MDKNPNKRNRHKFVAAPLVEKTLSFVNLLPFAGLALSAGELRDSLYQHVDGHSDLVTRMWGRDPRPCCYFLLLKQLSGLADELKNFLFSIEIDGRTLPAPTFIDVWGMGDESMLSVYPDYHPQYTMARICYGALRKYEDVLSCKSILETVVEFNDRIREHGGKYSKETLWFFQPTRAENLPPIPLKPDKQGSLRPDVPALLSALLASDTTRFLRCAICGGFFWVSRTGRRYCEDKCRQEAYRRRTRSKALDEEMNKLRKLENALGPKNKLIAEQKKRVETLMAKEKREK